MTNPPEIGQQVKATEMFPGMTLEVASLADARHGSRFSIETVERLRPSLWRMTDIFGREQPMGSGATFPLIGWFNVDSEWA